MSWRITYYDEVSIEVRDAKRWYYRQQPGLEKRFAEDIKQCIVRIKENPLKYEIRYRDIRLANCVNFPYAIHYYLKAETSQLTIIAIIHQRRDPQISRTR